jgi:hypothetical protein
MDLSMPKSLHSIGNAVQDMIMKGYPIRFGLVPKIGNNREGPGNAHLTFRWEKTILLKEFNE